MSRSRHSRWWGAGISALICLATAGCGSSPPWTAALRATAPKGSVMLFNRVSSRGYMIAAADYCTTFGDSLTAQVSIPRRYLKFYPILRTGSTPRGTLKLLTYFPYDGAVIAYAAASVAQVEWIGTDGRRLDTMAPVDGWVVEEGPKWPEAVPGDQGPPVGSLIALNGSGKRVASIAISSKNAVPPTVSVPTNPATPSDGRRLSTPRPLNPPCG